MRRLYSQLIGLPILLSEEKRSIGRVLDIVLDPDRGSLVALLATKGKIVASSDIEPWNGQTWYVGHADVLIDRDDLIRLESIPERKRWLVNKPVMTKSGEYLGRVADYVMNMETLSMVQVYVTKKFLFIPLEKRIIPWSGILEITEQAMIVKDQGEANLETLKDYLRLKKDVQAPLPMTIKSCDHPNCDR